MAGPPNPNPVANAAITGTYPYTVDQLIGSIRRRAFMPTDGDGSDTPSILQLLNEELPWLVAEILQAREGHFRQSINVPLVGGQNIYSLPIRAAGSMLDTIVPLDSLGNPCDVPLQEDDVEIAATYQQQSVAAYPSRYFFNGNSIIVTPIPSGSANSLQVYYPRRPSQVTLLASCYTIASLTPGSGNYTVGLSLNLGGIQPASQNYIPGGFVNGAAIDFVKSVPGFDVNSSAVIATATASVTGITATIGTGAIFTITLNLAGAITGVSVSGTMSGYTTSSVASVTGSGTGGVVSLAVSGGAITTVTVLNPGTGYGAVASIVVTAASGAPPLGLAVGDFCCLQDTAPVVCWVMPEALTVFAQYGAMKLLESRTDGTGYARAKDALFNTDTGELPRFRKFLGGRTRYQHEKVPSQLGRFRWGAARRPLGGWLGR